MTERVLTVGGNTATRPIYDFMLQQLGLGKDFYVDSTTGSDTDNNGRTPERAFATLDAALAKCTANKGDRVFILPNHTETITGAGGITLDIAGVDVIGLGRYDARPAFLMDGAATVTALVTAANCSLQNVVLKAGHADIAKAMLITAKGFKLDSVRFEQNATNENWVDVIHVGAADNDCDGLEIVNCEIEQVDAGFVTAIDILKNQNDVKILNNRIIGDFDATPYAPIYAASTEIMLNILVEGNLIHNAHDGNAAVGIAIANTSSTGWIVRNIVGHQDADGSTPILAGAAGLMVAENYVSSVLGTASGYLYPAADDGAS
jgi:hypothetical protein